MNICRLSCVWVPTGNVRAPLACIWTEAPASRGRRIEERFYDGQGGMSNTLTTPTAIETAGRCG
jgi:hypothetical protein